MYLYLNKILFTLNATLANSKDPDEMPHSAAFHQGLHCLLRSSEKEIQLYLSVTPRYIQWTIPSYCIKPEGKLH